MHQIVPWLQARPLASYEQKAALGSKKGIAASLRHSVAPCFVEKQLNLGHSTRQSFAVLDVRHFQIIALLLIGYRHVKPGILAAALVVFSSFHSIKTSRKYDSARGVTEPRFNSKLHKLKFALNRAIPNNPVLIESQLVGNFLHPELIHT